MSAETWACSVCTFANPRGAPRCEICGHMPSDEQQKVLDPHGWTCAMCTFRNNGSSLDDVFSQNALGGFGHVPSMHYTCQMCDTADQARQREFAARQHDEERRRKERLEEERRRAEAEKKRREADAEKKRLRAKDAEERERRQADERMAVFVPLYKRMFFHFSRDNIKQPRSKEWQDISDEHMPEIGELLETILKYSFIDDLIHPPDSERKLDSDGDVVMASSSSSSSSYSPSSSLPHKRMKVHTNSSPSSSPASSYPPSSSSSSSSASPALCQVCFCGFDAASPAFVSSHCGCAMICADCVKQYISLRVRDEDISPWIPCPGAECTTPLAPQDLVRSGVARTTLERLCLVHVRKHLARNKDWVACENAKCEFGFVVSDSDSSSTSSAAPRTNSRAKFSKPKVKSSKANKQRCIACRTSQVVVRACDKADESFNELIEKGELRPCPKCGNLQMKDFGICNIIQCPQCNIWWNWRTRATGRTQREMKQRARREGSLWEKGELNYQRNLEHTNLEAFKALLERNGQTYDPNYRRGM